MDISSGIQASLAGRYALALFGLAHEERQLENVAASLATVRTALAESEDFRILTTSPLVSRNDAEQAILATAETMGLDPITRNFLGVLARNGRLSRLDQVIRALTRLHAEHRGEVTAEIVSARPLDDDQVDAIRQNLRTRMGRDIAVDLDVDPAILGGLIVKVGSRMIDGSIRTRLNNLAMAMKG